MNALTRILICTSSALLFAGCATTTTLNSSEFASGQLPPDLSARKVAILPLAARIGTQKNLRGFAVAQEIYLERVGPRTDLQAGAAVEREFSQQPSLLAAYQRLVAPLLDKDPNLLPEKDGTKTALESKPWDGTTGIKYAELADINVQARERLAVAKTGLQRNSPMTPRHFRLQWNVIQKNDISYAPLPVAETRAICQALQCDYLLIPVVKESFIFIKDWFAIGIVPLFRTTDIYPVRQLALYLVDGENGEIVQALQQNQPEMNLNDALFTVVSLHKVLQKGSAFGSFDFQ